MSAGVRRHADVSNETIDAGVCRTCDRPIAYENDDPAVDEDVCLRSKPYCKGELKVDWRARAVAAEKRDDLGAALDSALRTSDYGKDKLITVMQRRYGREARQWQANHDQRKAELDVVLARVRELEAWFARYSIHGSPMLAVIAECDAIREAAARSTKENDELSKVYGIAACLRTFPVPSDDHLKLVDAVDACRQALHDLAFRDEDRQALECPHCRAGEPSVWDDVLFHYAHPADGAKLKMCHSPWRERCRRCSADVVSGPLCAACGDVDEKIPEARTP